MILVPDASIILKWVLQREDEVDFPKAFGILREYLAERVEIHLPTYGDTRSATFLG